MATVAELDLGADDATPVELRSRPSMDFPSTIDLYPCASYTWSLTERPLPVKFDLENHVTTVFIIESLLDHSLLRIRLPSRVQLNMTA